MSTEACACPPKHVEYLSEGLALNAVTLHKMRNPNCEGAEWFPCGDHFHIGHHTALQGYACKTDPEHVAAGERIWNGGRHE